MFELHDGMMIYIPSMVYKSQNNSKQQNQSSSQVLEFLCPCDRPKGVH